MDKKENLHAGHRKRKKEQFRQYGLDPFADHEALELLLYYAIPRADTNPAAHGLLRRFGSLSDVLKASVQELQEVPGVGENAALLVRLVSELSRRSQLECYKPGMAIRDSHEAGELFRRYFWNESREIVVELCLDGKCKLLALHRLAEGGTSGAALSARDAARRALNANAMFVYLAHNHPSGVAAPSQEDWAVTYAIQRSLSAVDIRLLDHIIVADNDYVSMAASDRNFHDEAYRKREET